MSTSTVTAPSSMNTDSATPPSEKSLTGPSLYARYVGAMLYFVGAGLIAGAVVHYPIDPPVYTVICIVGALVFLLGTIVNEFIFAAERPTVRRAVSLVTFSLLLSFGVGLLGGGIQHFEQFPERSAAMTPIGLLLSYAAFVAKDAEGRWRNVVSLFGAGIAVVAALSWFGMSALAETINSSGHEHGDDTSQSPTDNGSTNDAPGGSDPAQREERNGDTHDSTGTHDDGSHDH